MMLHIGSRGAGTVALNLERNELALPSIGCFLFKFGILIFKFSVNNGPSVFYLLYWHSMLALHALNEANNYFLSCHVTFV